MTISIIGVDCAAQPENTGLALAVTDGMLLQVIDARCASKRAPPSETVAGWVKESDRALLALDAPLGWPSPLGGSLHLHRAGEPLGPTANQMFRRLTDDVIHQRLGRRPLDIGADRIARAAHAALRLLQEVRDMLKIELPLVLSPNWVGPFGVIEVYPAATRIALQCPKGNGSLLGLENRLAFRNGAAPPDSEHVRDAIVCGLTGLEFLLGRTLGPSEEQREFAVKEGWIWAGTRKEDRGLFGLEPRRT